MNKERIINHNNTRRKLLINSDVYIATKRTELIEQLNNGGRKWISEKNKTKYNIQQCSKTLKFF
jgi:hypothetical protein